MQKKISQLYYFINEYNHAELSKLSKNINIIYRNYKKNIDISTLISIRNYCKENKIKFFISNNIKLAIKYRLDGIYIPSFNKQINFIKFSLPKNFEIIGSAHNTNEINHKIKQGCDFILFSKLFLVDYAKEAPFLDVIKFNKLSNQFRTKLVPLGGIKKKELEQVKKCNL